MQKVAVDFLLKAQNPTVLDKDPALLGKHGLSFSTAKNLCKFEIPAK